MSNPEITVILNGRTVVPWKDLCACFKVYRGYGFSYHTLQEWQTMEGFPCVYEGGRYLYSPERVWRWYLECFGSVEDSA